MFALYDQGPWATAGAETSSEADSRAPDAATIPKLCFFIVKLPQFMSETGETTALRGDRAYRKITVLRNYAACVPKYLCTQKTTNSATLLQKRNYPSAPARCSTPWVIGSRRTISGQSPRQALESLWLYNGLDSFLLCW